MRKTACLFQLEHAYLKLFYNTNRIWKNFASSYRLIQAWGSQKLKDIKKKIGRKIARARKDLKLSQEEFAELVGVHPTYIGAVERGEKHASVKTLHKISLVLKMTLSELFEGI